MSEKTRQPYEPAERTDEEMRKREEELEKKRLDLEQRERRLEETIVQRIGEPVGRKIDSMKKSHEAELQSLREEVRQLRQSYQVQPKTDKSYAWNVEVDREACLMCGACVEQCPSIFELDREGRAVVKRDWSGEGYKEAAEMCPTRAIRYYQKP
jgi:ferredoxin